MCESDRGQLKGYCTNNITIPPPSTLPCQIGSRAFDLISMHFIILSAKRDSNSHQHPFHIHVKRKKVSLYIYIYIESGMCTDNPYTDNNTS